MTTRKHPSVLLMDYAFKKSETPVVIRQAVEDQAALLHGRGVNVDNLVFLMGQEHYVAAMEEVETDYTNVLDEHMPFIHFCNELPPHQFLSRLEAFQDDRTMKLHDAAETFAKPLGTHMQPFENMLLKPVDYVVTSYAIVNALRNRRENHFIDLNKERDGMGGTYNVQTPDIAYYHRYKNKRGVLSDAIRAKPHLFSKIGAQASSAFGMKQRDVQMTGRIDDIMGDGEGALVASIGLAHVHDCYKTNRDTLTDYLLCAGKDVFTLSFLSNHYGPAYAHTHANFAQRVREKAKHYETGGANGTYHGHASFKLT